MHFKYVSHQQLLISEDYDYIIKITIVLPFIT
jgi:hypothetical protein